MRWDWRIYCNYYFLLNAILGVVALRKGRGMEQCYKAWLSACIMNDMHMQTAYEGKSTSLKIGSIDSVKYWCNFLCFYKLYLTQVIHYASITSYLFSWHACQSLSCQKKDIQRCDTFLQKFHSCSSQDPTSQRRSTSLRLSPAKDLILPFITCFPHPFSF